MTEQKRFQPIKAKVRNVKVGDIISVSSVETCYIIGEGRSHTWTETNRYYVQNKCQSPENMHRSWLQLCRIKTDGTYKLRKLSGGAINKMPRKPEQHDSPILYGAQSWLKSAPVIIISRKN